MKSNVRYKIVPHLDETWLFGFSQTASQTDIDHVGLSCPFAVGNSDMPYFEDTFRRM